MCLIKWICWILINTRGRGPKKPWDSFIKNSVFIFAHLNFCHLQSTFHLRYYTYQDFFPQLKTVFELVDFDAFQCFCHFLFHLSHISKMLPFEDFFHLGKQNKSNKQTDKMLGQDWVNREAGAQRSSPFWQTLLNTQHGVGRCTCKSLS